MYIWARAPRTPEVCTGVGAISENTFPSAVIRDTGMNVEEKVNVLENYLISIREELEVIEERIFQLEHLVHSRLEKLADGGHPSENIPADENHGGQGNVQYKKIIVFHPNPWDSGAEDIPWEGTENIDPNYEMTLKTNYYDQWLGIQLAEEESRRNRCTKTCELGHACNEIHQSLLCPPCTVLLQNFRISCKHRVNVLCFRRNTITCSFCSSKWHGEHKDTATTDLLSTLENAFARMESRQSEPENSHQIIQKKRKRKKNKK